LLTKRGIALLNSTFALVIIASFGFDPLFTPIALIMLTVLGVETMLYAKSLRSLRLTTATRRLSAESAFIGDAISVVLEIENKSRGSLGPIIVIDQIPRGFKTSMLAQDWILSIDGRSNQLIHYEIEPLQIGDWAFTNVEITLTDRFGIFKTVKKIPCESRIKVYPDMRKGEELLKGRIHLGIRPIRRSAITTPLGSEFSGIREYYPSDDVRMIAWKAMAKSAIQEPKTKQHENEQAINTILVICNSETSGEGNVGSRKLDKIVETAIIFSYIALKTGGMFHVVFSRDGKIERVSGRPLEMATKLYNIEPDPKSDIGALIRYASKITQSRSLLLAVVDSPYPHKINSTSFKGAMISNHFLHVLLIDTGSFFPVESSDKVLTMARDVVVSRELAHLRRLLSELAEEGITGQICGKDDLMGKAMEVFSNAGVIIEA
jgi:uncharacterized protein (DUF58 family)